MKNAIAFIFSLLLTSVAFAQADAIEYNDRIIEEQMKIGNKINDFVSSETNEQFDQTYASLLSQIDASIVIVEKLGGWEGETGFQKAAINLFKFYKGVAQYEYKEFLIILKKADEDITESDITYMQTLENGIVEKEKKYDDDFAYQQEAFANKYDIILEGETETEEY